MYYIWLLLPLAMFLFYLPNPVRGIVLAVVVLLIGIIAWHFCRTGTVEGVMKQIAIVILETLSDQGLIKTSIKQVGKKVHDEKGELLFHAPISLPMRIICSSSPCKSSLTRWRTLATC